MKITIAHLLVLLFSSLCLSEAFAENKAKEFRDYLPSLVKRDKYLLAEVENTFNAYGQLDPKIIYLYLEHLKLKYTLQISAPEKNREALLKKIVTYKEYQRSRWAAKQSKLVGASQYPNRIKKLLFKSYKGLMRPQLQPERRAMPSDIDQNKRDFFSYLWLTGHAAGEYDSKVDYAALFTESQKIHRDSVQRQIERGGRFEYSQFRSLLSQLISLSWQQAEFKSKMSADFSNVEVERPRPRVTRKSSNAMGIQLYNTHLYRIDEVDIPEDVFTQNGIAPVSFDFESSIGVDMYVGVQIAIRETGGLASYLFFQFGVAKQKPSEKYQLIEIFSGAVAVPNVGWLSGVYLEYKGGGSFLFQSQASIPIVNPFPFLLVDLGVDYRYLSTSLSYNVIRENFRLSDPEQAENFPETYKIDTTSHIISPVVAARVMLPFGFELRGGVIWRGLSTTSGYKSKSQLTAGLHYNIRL